MPAPIYNPEDKIFLYLRVSKSSASTSCVCIEAFKRFSFFILRWLFHIVMPMGLLIEWGSEWVREKFKWECLCFVIGKEELLFMTKNDDKQASNAMEGRMEMVITILFTNNNHSCSAAMKYKNIHITIHEEAFSFILCIIIIPGVCCLKEHGKNAFFVLFALKEIDKANACSLERAVMEILLQGPILPLTILLACLPQPPP